MELAAPDWSREAAEQKELESVARTGYTAKKLYEELRMAMDANTQRRNEDAENPEDMLCESRSECVVPSFKPEDMLSAVLPERVVNTPSGFSDAEPASSTPATK